ncbi:hypothetical protein JO380_002496 [Cellulomonas iranensis]|uniref:Uncharacterized protein n=1 Tax=Cellulomonas iranensis TaxID=76862 RepID=A0ABU0GNE9_9CELL|nr:hypothetical protein [Cellulomonas iranensis]
MRAQPRALVWTVRALLSVTGSLLIVVVDAVLSHPVP